MKEELKPLTRKQRIFVKTYLETGVGITAAKQAYEIESENRDGIAASIASENLTKPNVAEAIRKGQKDIQIEEAFDKLINLKRIDYFVFPNNMSNKEIEEHINAQGITVLNIRESDRGKLAFYAIPDGKALSKALDIWAKISGNYAPTKSVNINLNQKVEPSDKVKDLAKRLNYE